jgi:hypothetical protein
MQWAGGLSDGLIDHNTFTNPFIALTRTDVWTNGTAAWNAPIVPGTANALVFEDNTFVADDSSGTSWSTGLFITHDEDNASRTTIRHNTFNVTVPDNVDGPIEAHGNQDYVGRGVVMMEIYENDFNSTNTYRYMNLRGGSNLVFGNRFKYSTTYSRPAMATMNEEEAYQTDFFNPLRTTWSAQDQINNTFFWNNTINDAGTTSDDVQMWTANQSTFVQEGRDYWMHEPCDGTKGCSGGRTVWTDPTKPGIASNETRVTTGPNAFFPYTPLVYPHPLVQP